MVKMRFKEFIGSLTKEINIIFRTRGATINLGPNQRVSDNVFK